MIRKLEMQDFLSILVSTLEKEQLLNGCFPCSIFSIKSDKYTQIETTYFTATILNSLPDKKRLKNIINSAIHFLEGEKKEKDSFNYWAQMSSHNMSYPYPDDWDDTALANLAINKFSKKVNYGLLTTNLIRWLISTEVQEGGPYNTWFVDYKHNHIWKDIDLVVNSNIAYLFTKLNITLESIHVFIDESINDDHLSSLYYDSKYVIAYFISFHKNKRKLIEKLDYEPSNLLEKALFIIIYLRLNQNTERVRSYVTEIKASFIKEDFALYPFYLHQSSGNQKFYAGSRSLTATLMYESLQTYYLQDKISKKRSKYKNAFINALEEFNSVTRDIQNLYFHKTHVKLLKHDKNHEITLLSYWFNQSLKVPIEDSYATVLGSANLIGWISHTLLDKATDNGKPELLPAVKETSQLCENVFREISEQIHNPSFMDYYFHTLQTMAEANAWEVDACRIDSKNILSITDITLPSFGELQQLSSKSFGHALGPIAILFAKGYRENSDEVVSLENFFHHYLIAKQLNDDLHDWKEDLTNGHLSVVVTELLTQWHKRYGPKLNRRKQKKELQTLFWNTVCPTFCHIIKRECRSAKRILRNHPLLKRENHLAQLVDPLYAMADKTLREQKQAKDFLRYYSVE